MQLRVAIETGVDHTGFIPLLTPPTVRDRDRDGPQTLSKHLKLDEELAGRVREREDKNPPFGRHPLITESPARADAGKQGHKRPK